MSQNALILIRSATKNVGIENLYILAESHILSINPVTWPETHAVVSVSSVSSNLTRGCKRFNCCLFDRTCLILRITFIINLKTSTTVNRTIIVVINETIKIQESLI